MEQGCWHGPKPTGNPGTDHRQVADQQRRADHVDHDRATSAVAADRPLREGESEAAEDEHTTADLQTDHRGPRAARRLSWLGHGLVLARIRHASTLRRT